MRIPAHIALALIKIGFRLFLNWHATGKENVPETGPLVVVCNHIHLTDPLLLMSAFPRWITYMAKEELFRYPLVGPILRSGGVLPVSRGGSFEQKRDLMRQSEDVLRRGGVIALFPEGKRDRTGVLLKGKPGAAVLAAHTGAQIVPAAITGTEKLDEGGWLWKRPRLTVTIGEPFSLPPVEGPLSRSTASALGDEVMKHIAALLPPEKRGPYAG
jgi:1-acyl-sn-glycerol-3-phosphate acyltransferase